jgi:hypothetical protein
MYETSEGCDSGMLAIGARFSARAAVGLGHAAADAAAGPARQFRLPWNWFTAPGVPFAGNALPANLPGWGPLTGFCWAVQRFSIEGMEVGTGAPGGECVSLYKGASVADVVPQNFLALLYGNMPWWHPGRVGCILMPGQGVIVGPPPPGGTAPAESQLVLYADVIQFPRSQLPFFIA